MNTYRARLMNLIFLAAALLTACATAPEIDGEAPAVAEVTVAKVVKVDESSMLPLLGYLQQLARMSSNELALERRVLSAIPQSPATQVRLAMVLGQARGAVDLPRALALLDKVLKASDPAAASLYPLAQMLANQYQERLRFQAQYEKLAQQLSDSLRHSSELQQKLDALADIERSLPVRPAGGENRPGSLR